MSHHQLNTLTDDMFDSLVISHIICAEISDVGQWVTQVKF